MVKILIADDDLFISEYIQKVLKSKDFEMITATNGEDALALYEKERPDLLLLDVMMPKMDGFQVCQRIRERDPLVPILMLTAKHQTSDKVAGLNLGADDYITKPFDRHELIARIDTAIRRTRLMQSQNGGEVTALPLEIRVDDLRMNLNSWQAWYQDTAMVLSKTEFNLLKTFCLHPDKILDRDTLLREVWGYVFSGNTRTVDNFVMRLRKKLQQMLEAHNGQYPHLETVYGIGYRLRTSGNPAPDI
jgi:DNA-binding response OmpR family regulator